MEERFFITKSGLTPKIASTVLEGETIRYEDKTYIELSKKPRGKSILSCLRNLENQSRILIYK